jgi:hypothetical protein
MAPTGDIFPESHRERVFACFKAFALLRVPSLVLMGRDHLIASSHGWKVC